MNIVVIGGSAGGLEPLRTIVKALPAELPAAVFVVIRTKENAPSLLPRILGKAGLLPAIHAVDGLDIEEGTIYVAPPDHHLFVQGGKARPRQIIPGPGGVVQAHRALLNDRTGDDQPAPRFCTRGAVHVQFRGEALV